MYDKVGRIPNEKTVRAIEDAHKGVGLEKVEDLDEFFTRIEEELEQER